MPQQEGQAGSGAVPGKGKMTSRERVRRAIRHQPHDRVPLDLGGTLVTTISARGYVNLCRELGIRIPTPRINDTMQMVVDVDAPVREALGVDVLGLWLDGGTLRHTGAAANTDRQFTVTQNGATIESSGTGAVNFTSTAAVTYSGSGSRTITLGGTNACDVIIGASSDHYYHGPYGWHGAAMYNEAWEQREDYLEQRQNTYQQNATQRQSAAQTNQAQRQSAAQTNQAQRQSAAQTGQTQAQANQAQRQSAAQTGQAQRQANQGQLSTEAQSRQSQRQSAAATSSFGGGQAASQRSGVSSSSFSGYQNGSAARAQSARGSSSLSGGFRGGGRRR
jgi:hypothetical protein